MPIREWFAVLRVKFVSLPSISRSRLLLVLLVSSIALPICACETAADPSALLTTIAEAQNQAKISTDVLKLMLPCPNAQASADAFVHMLDAGFTSAQIELISHAFVLTAPSWKELLTIARTAADSSSKDLILRPTSGVMIPGSAFLDLDSEGLTSTQLAFVSKHMRVVATESDLVSLLQHPLDGNQLSLLSESLEPMRLKTEAGILAFRGIRNRIQFSGRVFIGDEELFAFAVRAGFTVTDLKPFVEAKPLHPAEVLAAFQKRNLTDAVAADFLIANRDKLYLDLRDLEMLSRSSLLGTQISRLLKETDHTALQLDPATVARLKLRGVDDVAILTLTQKREGGMPNVPDIASGDYGDPTSPRNPLSPRPAAYGPANQPSEAVYRIGGDVSAPILINKVEPEYSQEALKAKYSGTVLLSIVVDANGTPRDIHVIRPLGLGLDEKAIEAVMNWRFRPGMKGGHPVATQAQIEINFRLNDTYTSGNTPALHDSVFVGSKRDKDESKGEENLRVQIIQVQWNASEFGANGFGRANLIENDLKRGFEFSFSCPRPFMASDGPNFYPAKWKKPGSRLVITTGDWNSPNKHHSCELKISLEAFVYERRNAQLVAVPLR